jgi:purine-binding chemotaxis protein CheW
MAEQGMITGDRASGCATAESRHREGKYLTFRLADEEYGLEILKVKEIIGLMDITRMPKTPDYIRGVINLRGKVVPVMGLRDKFGMPGAEDSEQTCIIVVEIRRQDRPVMTGVLVDSVSEVLDIGADQIEDAPEVGGDVDTGMLLGIGKVRERVILMLDIEKVLTGEEMEHLVKS